jgi:uncharacterized membrane protein YagU involved in acid resistance
VFNGCHTSGCDRANVFITGIDNDFIENLVKARIEIEFPPNHLVRGGVIGPTSFLIGLGATNICIWKFQNMLVVSVLLILAGCHLGIKS